VAEPFRSPPPQPMRQAISPMALFEIVVVFRMVRLPW
jgi:hypothetical protein